MTIETFEKILGAHPFFAGLPPVHLETLVGCASNVTFEAGRFLCRAGQEANRFYVVRHGRVAVEIVAPGRPASTIETVTDGDVLGWSWLFPPYKWHFDARAVSFVQALALDGTCLRRKCEEDPRLGLRVLQRFAHVVVQRLEATQLQLLDFYASR